MFDIPTVEEFASNEVTEVLDEQAPAALNLGFFNAKNYQNECMHKSRDTTHNCTLLGGEAGLSMGSSAVDMDA